MKKTEIQQYDELSSITIDMDKKIEFLNKKANTLGINVSQSFLKSIEIIMDAKVAIEDLKEELKRGSTNTNFNAWVD